MRKAEEFEIVDDLGLPRRICKELYVRFGSAARAIYEVRKAAYFGDPKITYVRDGIPMCLSEKKTSYLIAELEKLDLIRHDLKPESFRIGALYRYLSLHIVEGHPAYIAKFEHFKDPEVYAGPPSPRYGGGLVRYTYSQANEHYEKFECPTPEQLADLRAAIAERLTDKERVVVFFSLASELGVEDFSKSEELLTTAFSARKQTISGVGKSAYDKLSGVIGNNPLPPFPIRKEDAVPESS